MNNKIKLTKSAVEKIQPLKGKQVFYWDTEVTGFGLRVSAGGSKSLVFQGRINGKIKKITIGKFGAITAETARKKAKEYAGKMAMGEDPAPEKTKEGASTLGDLMTAYIELLESQGKVSARNVKNQTKRDIELAHPRLWKKKANQINLDDCMTIVGKLKDQDKARQADKIRSYLRTAFSEAINSRGDVNMPASMRKLNITYNPARDMRKVKGSSQARDRALSLSELQAYWRRTQELPELHRALATIHLLTGGQRQKQLSRVAMSDIDYDTKCLTIWDYKGRRTEPRKHIIPLLTEVMEAISGITGGGQYVFSCDGGISPAHDLIMNDIVKRIRSQMEEAGELENGHFTAGSIRATVETRLAAKPYRVSSDILAHLLSHGMGGVQARHYQHHDFFDEKLEALEMLARMVKGEAEPIAQVLQMRATM